MANDPDRKKSYPAESDIHYIYRTDAKTLPDFCIAYKIYHDENDISKNYIRLSWAICSKDDKFDKKTGRDIATRRLLNIENDICSNTLEVPLSVLIHLLSNPPFNKDIPVIIKLGFIKHFYYFDRSYLHSFLVRLVQVYIRLSKKWFIDASHKEAEFEQLTLDRNRFPYESKVHYVHFMEAGYCFAYKYVESEEIPKIYIGISKCSLNDPYNKKTGRELALQRLNNGPKISLDLNEIKQYFTKEGLDIIKPEYMESLYYFKRCYIKQVLDRIIMRNFFDRYTATFHLRFDNLLKNDSKIINIKL